MDQNKGFHALLEKKDYVSATALLLGSGAPLYAGTVGLDGRPQVRPAVFAFAHGGALYFLTLKSSRMYAELCKTPFVQFCLHDGERGTTLRLSGKACFTEEPELIDRAAACCPEAPDAAGGERKRLILFFLLGAEALLEPGDAGEPERRLPLPDPSGVLIGIALKKKTELRDRLSRVLERRESQPPALDPEAAMLYDGALFVFAQAAKALWPRMDVSPLERAAVFETYDAREQYTARAASLIGNAVIDDPEDLTYWLDPGR